jgi:hypothetical protein
VPAPSAGEVEAWTSGFPLGTPRNANDAGGHRDDRQQIATMAKRDRIEVLREHSEQDQPDTQEEHSQLLWRATGVPRGPRMRLPPPASLFAQVGNHLENGERSRAEEDEQRDTDEWSETLSRNQVPHPKNRDAQQHDQGGLQGFVGQSLVMEVRSKRGCEPHTQGNHEKRGQPTSDLRFSGVLRHDDVQSSNGWRLVGERSLTVRE